MKNDDTIVQGGASRGRREPSLQAPDRARSYVQTAGSRALAHADPVARQAATDSAPRTAAVSGSGKNGDGSGGSSGSSGSGGSSRSGGSSGSGGRSGSGGSNGSGGSSQGGGSSGNGGNTSSGTSMSGGAGENRGSSDDRSRSGADGGRSDRGASTGSAASNRNAGGTAGSSGSESGKGSGGPAGGNAGRATAAAEQTGPTSTTVASGEANLPPIPELERMKGVGDTLNGRFVLEECIGFGGMGMVYKALDLRKLEASDRKPYIAIKVLNVQFRGHPKSLIALQREARKAQALAHPNIVAVYDFDRDGSMVYLTMEYLVGQPLSGLLRSPDFGGMSLADAMPIVAGMAKALAYAHQRGFVHCDLKPANVFLTDRGDVKVIDFGIARVFQKTEEDMDATVFDAGSLGGLTPAYASPEMLEHRVPDPRDDIYALACISYELLTGHHPFDRMAATQARGTGRKPLRPKGLSNRQWRALKGALSFDRVTRTATVTRFFDDFSDARRAAMRLAMIGCGGLLVVLLALAIGRYGTRGPSPAADTNQMAGAAGEERSEAPATTREPRTPVPFERQMPPASPQAVQRAQPALPPLPPLTLAAITPVLSGTPCSALIGSVREHVVEVKGFLSEEVGVARLKSQLARVPGVETVNADVRPIREKDCATISLFGPYWLKSRQSGATVRTRATDGQLTEGEPLIVDVTTPNYDTWVHVDYYVLDGGVTHLLPSVRARDNQAPPSYSATIGSFGNWVISKPFGTEMIVLMTTPAPLFKGLRPEYETTPDYLRDLKKQLRQMSSKYGADRIAVDLVQITSHAKKP